jgi:acetyltransferase-like isoleucine patch superfamily enzyme
MWGRLASAHDPVIHEHTQIGPGATIGPFVVLGVPPDGGESNAAPLVIGRDARIRSHSVIYAGNTIGDRLQTGHGVLIREANHIGDDVSIGSHSVVEHHVVIGDRVRVHSNAFIPEFSVLEDGVWVGPNVVLTNARYPLAPDAKATLRGPTVREGAKVGANATVLPGVVVGRNALIGAGAVVVRDVPDGAVVAGNPARLLRNVDQVAAYAGARK